MVFSVYSRNIQPSVSVVGSLQLPSEARGLSKLQTSSDLDLRLYIPGIHLNAMIYILHIRIYIRITYVSKSFHHNGSRKVMKFTLYDCCELQ